METIRIPGIMQDTCRTHLIKGKELGLVPTMGALHDGHMSLIRQSLRENHLTAVSIFVNPSQFGPGEDFERYPRQPEEDAARLRAAGVDILFVPSAEAMYPKGFNMSVDAGPLGGLLCGAHRPGHFSGVATVVAKLFNIAMPRRAYFGSKDFQQAVVIRNMARGLNFPVEVVACPTIREPDGLAMSSRNKYLSPEERGDAAAIHATLSKASDMLKVEGAPPEEVAAFMQSELDARPLVSEVQYAGVYDPETLEQAETYCGRALLAVAVRVGGTRLIDNVLA